MEEGINEAYCVVNMERLDCRVQPVLCPYIATVSTMRFCRKFSRNNMARVGL